VRHCVGVSSDVRANDVTGHAGIKAAHAAGSQQRRHDNASASATVVMPTEDDQPITDDSVIAAANSRTMLIRSFFSKISLVNRYLFLLSGDGYFHYNNATCTSRISARCSSFFKSFFL